MIKCTSCGSDSVELRDEPCEGSGRIQSVVCLDCGFDKNPKVFSRPSGTHGAMVIEDECILCPHDLDMCELCPVNYHGLQPEDDME